MALECEEVGEWVDEEVSKPVEEFEERTEERCKNWPWPLNWACKLVTTVVKVVRWVTTTVTKWVVRTICKGVTLFVDFVKDVASGLWDIVVGIFTLDWRRILDGLIDIGLSILTTAWGYIRIITLIDTIDFIVSEINKWRLKNYVRSLLEDKNLSSETFDKIADQIRLNNGAFGLRLKGAVYRTFLDSETIAEANSSIPNLIQLHENGSINLRELCGFEFNEGFWNRKRYKTLKKGPTVSGGGGGEFDNPISEDELNTYLDSRGTDGPPFIVLPTRDGVLGLHTSIASEKARELCLMMRFDKELVEVTETQNIDHPGSASANTSFLQLNGIDRTDKSVNDLQATGELCRPVGISIFKYENSLRGLASNLRESDCGLDGNSVSGVTYIDNRPDKIWKYVLVHEFGHYFGLCHVDGFDRIMYSSKQNSWWHWSMIPNFLFSNGPRFTFGEAKATWKYILDNFQLECLGADPQLTSPIVE